MVAGTVVAGWICMAISGVFLAVQSGVNLTLGANLGKSFAAVISFATGLVVLIIFWVISTQGLDQPMPTMQGVKDAPWWAWVGGPLGAWYVASIIIFGPILGAANALSIFVALQLVTALILDSFGLVGYKKRPFHWARALGLVLLVTGVVLIAKFDGGSESSPPAPEPSSAPPSEAAASELSVIGKADSSIVVAGKGSQEWGAPPFKAPRVMLELVEEGSGPPRSTGSLHV